MKAFLYTVAAGVTVGLVFLWWKNRIDQNNGMLTQAQKDAGNNAVLDAYSILTAPIAQLARVPWTNTNLRSVDPVIPAPVSLATINQNGQQ